MDLTISTTNRRAWRIVTIEYKYRYILPLVKITLGCVSEREVVRAPATAYSTLDQSNEALGIAPATTDKIREEAERLSDQSKEIKKITVMVKGKESASLLLCFRKTHTAQPRQ